MKTAFSNIVFGLLTFSLTLPPQVFAQSNANVANSTEFAHLRRDLGKALTKMNSQGARFSLSPDFSNNLPLSEDSVLGVFDASGTKNIYELIHDKSGAEVGLHLTMKLIDQNPTVQVEMMDVSDKHLVEFETPIRT